jgi:hypothetical protein
VRAPVKIERQDTPGIRYREDLTWISSRYQFDLHLMLHAYPEEILVLRATRLQRALEQGLISRGGEWRMYQPLPFCMLPTRLHAFAGL